LKTSGVASAFCLLPSAFGLLPFALCLLPSERRFRPSARLEDNEDVSADPVPLGIDIARLVRDRGGRALVVGVCVRDRLLGRMSKDLDIEVFGVAETALPGLLAQLGRVEAVGQAFAVYKIDGVDVSLPRRESKTGRGHKGFTVTGDPAMTPAEAARRRDFT